ncbi:hypothetical protein [Formosa algae]|uniref:hypothetical protein n=1 Tax=Formosa algae TaxID=225843 RepID=UPI000CCE2A92|nr:hypothetical protein [Formosa algae]PNW27415.1 hypothetical protein BKP44_13380 [Formosa algae]
MKKTHTLNNVELMKELDSQIKELKGLNNPNLKSIVNVLDEILTATHIRLSIATKEGFYETFKDLFNDFEDTTRENCFIGLNQDYKQYFDKPMYKDYTQFKNAHGFD